MLLSTLIKIRTWPCPVPTCSYTQLPLSCRFTVRRSRTSHFFQVTGVGFPRRSYRRLTPHEGAKVRACIERVLVTMIEMLT